MGDVLTFEQLFQQALQSQQAGRFAEAIRKYRAAAQQLPRSAIHWERRLMLHLEQAHCYRLLGKFGRALQHYRWAANIAAQLGDEEALVDVRAGEAMCHRALGNLELALSIFDRLLQQYKAAGDQEGYAYTLWASAGALRFAGDLASAYHRFEAAYHLFEEMQDAEGLAYTLCGLGGVSRLRGMLDASFEFYTEANQRMRKRRDQFGTAYSYCGIGNVYRMRGDFATALRFFARAGTLYTQLQDRVSYAYTLWAEATIYKIQQRWEVMRATLEKAHRFFRSTHDPRGEVYVALTKAEVAHQFGQQGRAAQYLRKAERIAQQHGYQYEYQHSQLIAALQRGSDPQESQIAAAYRSLGVVQLPFPLSFPLNLP